MDIYTQPGSKVVFIAEGGMGHDVPDAIMSGLQKDAEYTVSHLEVGGFSSRVYLKEFPGMGFNTVMFEDSEARAARLSREAEKLKQVEGLRFVLNRDKDPVDIEGLTPRQAFSLGTQMVLAAIPKEPELCWQAVSLAEALLKRAREVESSARRKT